MNILVVGAGLYGAVVTRKCLELGHKVSVIEQRSHLAGNCYTEKKHDIDVHKYGPHIFHTSIPEIWNFANQFSDFKQFHMTAKAHYKGNLYSFPINLQTLKEVWGVKTPEEAKLRLEKERVFFPSVPKTLEEQALSQIGWQLYSMFIKDYVYKQWGKTASELPAFIIQRIPIRLTYNDSYYNDSWVGIPKKGYTTWIENMLDGSKIYLNVKYVKKDSSKFDKIFYSGCLDSFFDYKHGTLEYRSLRFVEKEYNKKSYQGIPMVTYPEKIYDFTRKIEHKCFLDNNVFNNKTIVTTEYPSGVGDPYYPINTQNNLDIVSKYKNLAKNIEDKYIFGGRLGTYKYLDMDKVIKLALEDIKKNIC